MTFNNSVLLILKHNPGIDYNDLLAKISPRYKSPASAKSALARALKDMSSFGLVKCDSNKWFLTDKGSASMIFEMKDKLVMRLNEEMKRPSSGLDEIVRLLVVLNQRGSQDKDLLNNARQNSTFSISDIEALRRKIRAQRKNLKKMSLLLEQQAQKLRELDFNDSIEIPFDTDTASKLAVFCAGQKVTVETKDNDVLSKIPEHWKKQGFIQVEGESVHLFAQLLSSMLSAKAVLYAQGLKVTIMAGKATFFGPYLRLKEFSGMKISEEVKKQEEAQSAHASIPQAETGN